MSGEDSRATIDEELLISLARELTDTAAIFREVRNSTSSVTIHAGGITGAAAICVAVSSVVVMVLFACWVMWQVADSKAQQEAWISVWQQRISDTKDK